MIRANTLHTLFARATQRFDRRAAQLRQLPAGPNRDTAQRRLRITGRAILRIARAEVAALQQGA